ncbi:MAG: helix-turn-helix domain-containing protein [Chloroflexi bacterium]|nr:helix-turn-helix domain-containing protein [Chloroflexota bacterium]
MEGEYITIEEAAALLKRSRPTVWRLIREYNLQTFRHPMDKRAYLRREDIEKLSSAFRPKEKSGAD